MIIRKLFKFENAHVVRGCSSVKCRSSIHGHSYKVELLFESNFLDNGQMVYDFGLMKQNMKAFIDAFDHSIALWNSDDKEYLRAMKKHSDRWVGLPISPSAEQFSRVIYILIDKLLSLTSTSNGERNVTLNSVIVHETDTGYAQCFENDAHSEKMGHISLKDIIFSDAIVNDWADKQLFDKLKNDEIFTNPKDV